MATQQVDIIVEGMTCANCASSLNKYLEKKGATDISVNFMTNDVSFVAEDSDSTLESLKHGIGRLGFTVVEEADYDPHAGHGHAHGEHNLMKVKRLLMISSIFTLPLVVNHLAHMIGFEFLAFLNDHWVQFALCLPVYIIGVYYFGLSAWKGLRAGIANMDVLIFIGSTAAFVYSLIGAITNDANLIFFETAATIIALVLLGNYLEEKAVNQTSSSIDELSSLQAVKARKLLEDGSSLDIDAKDIKPGDRLIVAQGDQVPVDGYIVKGQALIDESLLTGESLPISKDVKDFVVGASILTNGSIEMRASALPNETVLSKMIDLVKKAQSEKPDIQRLADKISSWFVPVVLGISVLTFVLGYFVFGVNMNKALMSSIAVLVISCPCAMGLATPAAVMVGVGRMAQNGILIKGGATLEQFAQAKHFVFDKTGTLTNAALQIKDFEILSGDATEVKNQIFSIEQNSQHPIASSIINHLKNEGARNVSDQFIEIKEVRGKGMFAQDQSGRSYELIQGSDYDVEFLKDGVVIAGINVQDELRTDAEGVIQYLNGQNIQSHILSGDKASKVTHLGSQLGISNSKAEQSPKEKLEHIKKLSDQGMTIMVGDGINDAPALTQADIGVSLSEASKIAMQSSEIVLMNNSLGKLKDAHHISKLTLKTIKQNLFWAFAYNVVAIPVAALGFLNPMLGALFMAFSDVVIILNSLKLKFKKL